MSGRKAVTDEMVFAAKAALSDHEIGVTESHLSHAAMRAAIEAAMLHAPNIWRSIETAPKDGTRVLAFAGSRPFIARHGRTVGWWDDNDLMRDPTHWQPLPPPPIAAAPKLAGEGND